MNKQNISILVVDDEEMIVSILKNFLDEKGYNVTGVTDAEEAITLVQQSRFDVIFTDLMMPGINGMELIKEVRSQEVDTQIVIFTGYASVDSAIDAVQQGVYDYIKKPFRLEDIDNILTHALEELLLKRENVRLHAQVKRTLSQITMLYDVSNIIYQVNEKKYALEMVFDTMAESMSIHQALICQAEEDEFRCTFQAGVSPRFQADFHFVAGSRFSDVLLGEDEITLVDLGGQTLDIDGRDVELEDTLQKLIMVPIRYKGTLEGYLAILEPEGFVNPFEDELTLLKIVATQIAPIIGNGKPKPNFLPVDHENEHTLTLTDHIQAEINHSKSSDTPVSFALARLVSHSRELEAEMDFSLLRETWRNKLGSQLGAGKRLYWVGIDTLLIVSSGGNPVGLDHHLANARYELESESTDGSGPSRMSMAYGIKTFPFDANTSKKLASQLSSRLFYDASEMNIKP